MWLVHSDLCNPHSSSDAFSLNQTQHDGERETEVMHLLSTCLFPVCLKRSKYELRSNTICSCYHVHLKWDKILMRKTQRQRLGGKNRSQKKFPASFIRSSLQDYITGLLKSDSRRHHAVTRDIIPALARRMHKHMITVLCLWSWMMLSPCLKHTDRLDPGPWLLAVSLASEGNSVICCDPNANKRLVVPLKSLTRTYTQLTNAIQQLCTESNIHEDCNVALLLKLR